MSVIYILCCFATALGIAYFSIPAIIRLAKKKDWYDKPGERHMHVKPIPSLGGVAIFAAVLFSICLWTPDAIFGQLKYIFCAIVIVFLIGLKDDIHPLTPHKKLAGQIIAAAILVFLADIQLNDLHGIFGIYTLPKVVGYLLSIFTFIVIINGFNLIDGINGLSGSIGLLISLTFGIWFYFSGRYALCVIAFSLMGALLGFLKYNYTPAKIFMGDTGSLLVGLLIAILTIEFIALHNPIFYSQYPHLAFSAAPAMAISILMLPLFDTLRVFVIRIWNGQSPLSPDRRHIHHLLIDHGFSHTQATLILLAVNLFFILVGLYFQYLGPGYLILLLLALAVILSGYLYFSLLRKKQTG